MGIVLKLPNKDGTLIDIEITQDLDIFFLDYDLECDLLRAELGEGPTICSAAYMEWLSDPMNFLCGSGLVQVEKIGIITCGLALHAIRIARMTSDFECFDASEKLVRTCQKTWQKTLSHKKTLLKSVYEGRQDLIYCWNRCINYRNKRDQEMPSFGHDLTVTMALLCAKFILDFWGMVELQGGYTSYPKEPCEVSRIARNVIAASTYDVHDPWFNFKHLMESAADLPDDLIEELSRINREQAQISVSILETLS